MGLIKHYNQIMNNLTITNNYKDSIIVANLQEKVKDYARHVLQKTL